MTSPAAASVRYTESLRFLNAACFTHCPWQGPYPQARTTKWRLTAHKPGCPVGKRKTGR